MLYQFEEPRRVASEHFRFARCLISDAVKTLLGGREARLEGAREYGKVRFRRLDKKLGNTLVPDGKCCWKREDTVSQVFIAAAP